ncbi:hypothetical protein [Marinitoga lauensis]|uniref:hypothetical protein n=1 Tax=Marinitoga lauensis TaxID=2201189 RepID=UPI0010119BA6|nr:hypothetical protein [Marinitoga lauensis]
MKNKIFLIVSIILSLSTLFAFGGNVNQNIVNNTPAQISLSLSIEELDNYTFSALAIDDKGTYYILRLSPLLMYYGNLPINVKDMVTIDGIVLSNFTQIKEIIVNTININNKAYTILNNNGYMNNQFRNYNRGMMNNYGMMGGYGYPGMMNGYGMGGWYDYYPDPYDYEMMNRYGYPMNGYGYPGNMNNYNQNVPNNNMNNMNGRK